jgi:hypothetical protein
MDLTPRRANHNDCGRRRSHRSPETGQRDAAIATRPDVLKSESQGRLFCLRPAKRHSGESAHGHPPVVGGAPLVGVVRDRSFHTRMRPRRGVQSGAPVIRSATLLRTGRPDRAESSDRHALL